jgi:hypothetical protein
MINAFSKYSVAKRMFVPAWRNLWHEASCRSERQANRHQKEAWGCMVSAQDSSG